MSSILFLALIFLTSFTAQAGSVQSAAEIRKSEGVYCKEQEFVDIHAHVGCLDDGSGNCFISDRLRKERIVAGLLNKYQQFFSAFGVSEADLLAKGNSYFFQSVSERLEKSTCVKSAVLLALDAHYDFDSAKPDFENTDFFVKNQFVAENVKKYKNLLWGASVNPLRKDFAEELAFAAKNGAVLIKLIPPIMGVQLGPDEVKLKARMEEYYRLLAKNHLPLLVHVDEEGTFSQALEDKFRKYIGVQGVRAALDNGVTVIVAHAATRDTAGEEDSAASPYLELLKLMAEPKYQGKLYADISALPTISTRSDHLCRVMKDYRGMENRLLWGSDFPLNYWKMTTTLLLGPGCGRGVFSTTSDESYAFNQSRHQWDRAVFLQKNMGATDAIFNATRKFLLEQGRVHDEDGFLRPNP